MKEKNGNIENLFGDLKKENPFRVPENYFETFADRLNARIKEDERSQNMRTLFSYLKPIMAIAAILVLVMLLVYVPVNKYFSAYQGEFAQNKSGKVPDDSTNAGPAAFIANFSEEQLLSAFSEVKDLDSKKLSSENLADYIAANFSNYEILADN